MGHDIRPTQRWLPKDPERGASRRSFRYRSPRRSQSHHRPRCRDSEQRPDLRMSEQELNSAEIACPLVDQHRLHSTQCVRAGLPWVEPYARDPFLDEPSILPCRPPASVPATGEEGLTVTYRQLSDHRGRGENSIPEAGTAYFTIGRQRSPPTKSACCGAASDIPRLGNLDYVIDFRNAPQAAYLAILPYSHLPRRQRPAPDGCPVFSGHQRMMYRKGCVGHRPFGKRNQVTKLMG